MAMDMMIEYCDPKQVNTLISELTGPFRLLGDNPLPKEDWNAPSWWHGDDEAFSSMQSAMTALPQRSNRRKK